MTAFLRPEKTQTKPCRVLGRPTHSPLQTSQLSFYFCLNNICCRHIFQGLRTFAAVKDLHCSSCLQHIPTINQAPRLLPARHTGAPYAVPITQSQTRAEAASELSHPSHRLQVPDHQTLQRVPPHVQSVHRRNALVQLPRICSPGHPQSLLMFLHSPHAPPHMPTKQLESVAPTTASLQLILEALAIRAPCADAHPLMLAWHRRHTKIAVKKSVPD